MATLIASAIVTALVAPLVLIALRRYGVMDRPGPRSSHSVSVPRGGGIACVVGVTVSLVLAPACYPLLVPSILLAAVGFMDDLHSLSATLRLALQAVGGLAMAAVVRADFNMPLWELCLAVGFFVAYVNAFNFMDGVNGISSLNAILSGGWFFAVGTQSESVVIAAMGAAVCGAGLGFLPWNAPMARVFLGDVGSYFLGAVIASLAVISVANEVPILLAVAPMVAYLADTAATILIRLRRGDNILQAHREHAYQRIADRHGHSASAIACTAAGAASAVVVGTWSWPVGQFLGLLVIVSVYIGYPVAIERTGVPR